ncbi:MAG: phenylalanine--tRNA ligase subunit beta [Desulfatiglans sp.]|jgi:phenylalanyl-tRNA synthetase beta chain|nr:phenylalanine--tRNA ligase subunit beta [Desulfatiglans sp.]
MKVSLNWLRDYVDIDMSPDDLGHALTMTGLEVEKIERVGGSLDKVIVARISKIEPHPAAEKLSICHMDIGSENVPVVCGAPNVKEGCLVPLALPGARLEDGTVIKESRIRGEDSKGMILAEDEMGLTDDHTGIMILPHDLMPGDSLSKALSLPDWVFDLDLTPNRPDCASVVGVAREIAAVTGKTLKWAKIELAESGPSIGKLTSVTIDDPVGCPRYSAGVILEIEIGPSPFWMRYRLYQSGIRSINNIVDVTNYVMLELGQPLHAFDYDRLRENRIVVRRAHEGEVFTTLDGKTHTLNSETLMICDGQRPVALAGIMGGLNSEIFEGTRSVLMESAFFDPMCIRRTSKGLGLSTEASYRFERGDDIGGVTKGLKRSLGLINQLAGGEVASGVVDNYPVPYVPPMIDLRVDKTNRFLGTHLSKEMMAGHLRALEMKVRDKGENILEVEPPSFRVDIAREVDLIEEVARLTGFDNIPVTQPKVRPTERAEQAELGLRNRIKEIMVGLGFTETITFSFVSPASVDILGVADKSTLRSFVNIVNPLSIEESVLRTSLIPGIISTIRNNILIDEKELKVFEWGKAFIRKEGRELPLEQSYLVALMSGPFQPQTWYQKERPVDFYDIKGAAEVLLKSLWFEDIAFEKISDMPGYDSDLVSHIKCGGCPVGQVGRVSSKVLAAYDIENRDTYVLEIDIEALMKIIPREKKFRQVTRFPAVHRDISLLVDRGVESGKIMDIIKQEGGELLDSVRIFDIYEGDKIDPSEKSLAFRICYRSEKRTLDGGEINDLHEKIIDRIRQESGGRLREG